MIRDEQIPELDEFRSIERKLSVANQHHWAQLVVYRENERLPVHNWFRFKEGFSANLLDSILTECADGPRELVLLDPFCGVGTSLLSAQLRHPKVVVAVGIERNPFIHFVAKTKVNWFWMDADALLSEGMKSIDDAGSYGGGLPELSSIREGRCISRHIAGKLLRVISAIPEEGRNREFLRLGVAACVEMLSRVRRDGRALRIVSKPIRHVRPTLQELWAHMARDVSFLKQSITSPIRSSQVLLGDGRQPSDAGIEEGSVDLIVTSPPYPNNIDYTEVYKLELWLLGFVRTKAEFLALRRSTFRSHPTYDRNDAVPEDFGAEVRRGKLAHVLGNLVTRLEQSDDAWRAKLLTAYFGDMWRTVRNLRKCLARNGKAALVVGNSLHGTCSPALVPTDLILARIAECQGMKAEVFVARGLKRRLSGNHFLRESVVLMKKK